MAFRTAGSLNPHGAPINVRRVLANSITVTEGDSIKIDSNFADLGEATTGVFGHASGISTDRGVGVTTDGSAGADFGSYQGSFTTASDNQTDAKVKVEVDISKQTLYSADISAALGTTVGSDSLNAYFDLADEETLDESSYSAAGAQYNMHQTDPADADRIIVNIFESSVFGS